MSAQSIMPIMKPLIHINVLWFKVKNAITKEQAISTISEFCRISLTDIINISVRQIDSKGWICQAWNPSILSKSKPEQMIKDCVNVLESEKLIVTSKNLKARLRKYHGTHFMNRHKYLIDVIMKCSEYFTNKVTVRIDHNENFTNGGGKK